jgi:hypothetical protein
LPQQADLNWGIRTVSFKQELPAFQLSIEQVREDLANPRFRVVLAGETLIDSPSKRKALRVYETKKRELAAAHPKAEPVPFDRAKWLVEERARTDIQAMRSEWLTDYGHKSRRGGKGGRGGV